MLRSWILRGLVAALVAGATSPALSAQTPPGAGTISGTVTLQLDGSPVHGATIIVVGARRTATTGPDGTFAIPNVPAGAYEVVARREHLTAERQTVTVAAGAAATVTFALVVEALHEEVAVTASATGASTAFDSFSSVTSLDSLELAANRGPTIADTLAMQPGISVRSFGPGNARPIIRGFDGDRVLVMQDGVRSGDLSSQSGDHGVSIDPASLERLEVVKGPATLLYGSNAIGGVVNAITPQEAFRATPFTGIIGGVSTDVGSGNAQAGASGNLQYGQGPWTMWGGGGYRRAGDYRSPDGVVENSDLAMTSGRFGGGWTGERLFFSVGGQVEHNRFGVPFGGELHAHAHEGAAEDEHGAGEHLDIDIESLRRELRFDGGLRQVQNAFIDNLKATFALTGYNHDEIEIAGGTEEVATHFTNDTITGRAELEQKRMGRLSGRLGVDWLNRDYASEGEEVLSPPTTQHGLSAFAYEELDFGRFRLQIGGRVERNAYRPGLRPESEHEHEHDDAVADDGHDEHAVPDVRDRTFVGASGSAGLHADIGRTGAFVVNVTTASRAPALEELYNFGPHAGNMAFEIGNPDLEIERTLGIDLSLRRRADRLSGEVNVFAYKVRDFVFLDFTGETVDGLREAEYAQGDSRFVGAELSGDVQLGRGVHVEGSVSMVNARLTATDEALPRIPPVSGRVRFEVPWRGLTFGPELVVAAAQRDVFRDETPTDGYGLLNFGASYFVVRGHATHTITLTGRNLTNEEYFQHTSFIKNLAPEMGRSVKLTYSVKFF